MYSSSSGFGVSSGGKSSMLTRSSDLEQVASMAGKFDQVRAPEASEKPYVHPSMRAGSKGQ
jgi:hypothetical protein